MPLPPLNPALYPRGTFCAAAGLVTVAFYYHHIWGLLKNRPEPHASPAPASSFPDPEPESKPFVERNYLYGGLALSILTFLLAGFADTLPNPLDKPIGALMGLCGVLFAAMFAYALVALWYLWKEWISQLKHILYLKRIAQSNEMAHDASEGSSGRTTTGSFLRAIPVAIVWLVAGFAVFLVVGVLLLKPLEKLHDLYQHLVLGLLAFMFYTLWKSRSHAAIVLRFILLFLFSALILAATFFALAWAVSQTAPLLVTFLAAITALNTLFYARWVRLEALIHNME